VALVEDFFDPNTWDQEQYEFRIYADDYANDYAVVDQIDYQYLIQWRWKICLSKPSREFGKKKRKPYLSRSVPTIVGKDYYDDNGKRHQNRVVSTIYLHRVVMERTGIPQPKTNQQIIVDHANGNEFDCRRKNLRWATLGFNNKNRFGSHEHVLLAEA
jgi:HNH endonuclease